MWRFYLSHPRARPTDMARAARFTWTACDRVYNTMNDLCKNIIREYHSVQNTDYAAKNAQIARKYHVPPERITAIINAAYRDAAIERGIADR